MKKSKLTNWAFFITILLFSFSLNAQINSENTSNIQATTENAPDVVSCDCNNSEASCTGTKIWKDGSKYEGEFKYGKINGKGKLFLPDGSSFNGDFENGTMHGYGTMIYEDGSKYIGDWINGYSEGQGSFVFPDGSEYFGEFHNDNFHGEGVILLGSGESYSGSWENGLTHGYGMVTRADGSEYLGFNQEGERHGAGMIIYESGDTLHGNWKNGNMDEEGIFQFADGSTMISFWENGKMSEEMVYTNPDGFEVSGSSDQLASQLLQNSLDGGESEEANLGLAFYSIGMEFKSMQDFDKAEQNFQFAMQFNDSLEDTPFFQMVETQMANLSSEKESSGVAKANKKE